MFQAQMIVTAVQNASQWLRDNDITIGFDEDTFTFQYPTSRNDIITRAVDAGISYEAINIAITKAAEESRVTAE